MHIGLYLDRSRHLRWHQWLLTALNETPGCRASIVFAPQQRPLPRLLTQAFALECAIYGRPAELAIDNVSVVNEAADNDGAKAEYDVLIDIAGLGGSLPASRRVLTPLFNSVPTEVGAVAALFDEGPVTVGIYDSCRTSVSLAAVPATRDRLVVTRALDGVLSRTIELLLKTLRRAPAADDWGAMRPPLTPMHRMPVLAATPLDVAQRLGSKLVALIGGIAAGGHSWTTAYRLGGTRLLSQHPADFTLLRDDRRRYYADPFPFVHAGQRYIFLEEFPFATQRGCIAVAAIDDDGQASTPRIVLEEPHHLSYPFVFEHDGDVWMIPESGEAKRIDLYRAERFPDRWTHEATLIDNVAAYDATLLRHDGRLWLFASLARWSSTSWDNLSLFHAADLLGPWTAYADNPVLLDARKSRPGGAFFTHNGAILRPVQDCSDVYGGDLAFERLDALTPTDYRQSEAGRIVSNMRGCHTYNRHGDIETIDVFGSTRGLTHITASYLPAAQPKTRQVADAAAAARAPESTSARI